MDAQGYILVALAIVYLPVIAATINGKPGGAIWKFLSFILCTIASAIPDFDTAIRLNPKYIDAYNNRGIAYFSKGQYDRAIADHTEAIRLDPKNAVIFYNRGFVYERKGELEKALADYNLAVSLNSSDKNALEGAKRVQQALAMRGAK